MSDARTANLLGALASAIAEPAAAAPGRRGGRRDAALVTLAQWPVESLEELRRALALSHSATVRLVDALVADGLAVRHAAGRGPAVAVKLTAAGSAAAERVLAARRARVEPLVAALGAAQQAKTTTSSRRCSRTSSNPPRRPTGSAGCATSRPARRTAARSSSVGLELER